MSTLEDTILHGLREENADSHRDSFGISYGLAREGTRQLKSYIQSQLSRTRTRTSIRSNESKDSRFESASGSVLSLQQSQIQCSPERQKEDDEYEDYLPEDYSDGSWETHHTSRDSQGNIIEYGADDSPEVVFAAAQSKIKPSLIPNSGLKSSLNSPMPDIGSNARIVPGAVRRPISVDAKTNKRASKAKVETGEMDYTAYI